MTKFVDDEWLKTNDLWDDEILKRVDFDEKKKPATDDVFKGATVKDLHLKPVVAVKDNALVSDVISILRDNAFDQLPVLTQDGKLTGLVTLSQLLKKLSTGKVNNTDTIKNLYLDFRKLNNFDEVSSYNENKSGKKKFVQFTSESTLAELNKFFEKNSSAVITDGLKPVHIVTKMDLLSYLASTA